MRPLPIPETAEASHEAVLSLVERAGASGLHGHIRVVLAKDPRDPNSPWLPAIGKLDFVRGQDPPPHGVRPKGFVRVLDERVTATDLIARIQAAMAGGPFMTSGEQVTGHGMNSVWHAYHHTWDWLAQGASWPCVVAAPHSLIAPRPRIYDVIEDDGPAGVFDGLEPLVRRVTGLRQKSTQGCDVRFSRFQVLIWDYRGRIDRFKLEASSVTVGVSPKNDPSLKLIGLISGGGSRKVIKVDGPADLSESLGEALTVAKFALKSGEDIVAEVQRDLEQEAIIATLDGRTIGPTLIDEIVATFERCVRPAFQAPPTSEKQLQLEVEKILRVLGIPFHREKERAPIGVTSFIPDFTVPECNLAIETKLAKTGHGEVAIQRELVEDCAGYRTRWTDLVAIVYDCDGTIRDPERMRQASSQLGIRLVIVKH